MASILSRSKLSGFDRLTPSLATPTKSFSTIINTSDIKKGTPTLPSKVSENKTLPDVAVVDRDTQQIQLLPPDDFKKYGKFLLEGNYSQNSVTFDKFSFDDISGLDTVKFEFILKLVNGSDIRYYTSTKTLTDLLQFNSNNSPYFSHESLKPSSVVTVDIGILLNLLSDQRAQELVDGTNVYYNLFLDTVTNVLDYVKLVEYIDWVVSKPPTNYDDRIIPAGNLGVWSSTDVIPANNVELNPKSEPITRANEIKPTIAESLSNVDIISTLSPNEINIPQFDLIEFPSSNFKEISDSYFGYGGGTLSS